MSDRFGPFEINPQSRELLLNGRRIRLQPRVFDVLAYLIRHRDRVVGKEELLNTLWPDVIVTDASLQRVISQIRAALAPGGWAEAIETRARVGYRFRESGPDAPATAAVAAQANPALAGFRLLERDVFLAELRRCLPPVQAGGGRTVFIAGEAGIGKSALISAFLEGVGDEFVILRGYCDALFTPRAFGAVLDLVAQLPGAAPAAEARQVSREKLFGGILRQLRELPRPVILLLEDLHWADDATMDFVRFLSRRIGTLRCLFVASYREEQAGAGPGDLSDPRVLRLHLPVLSAPAVAQLVGESGPRADRICLLTGGNPFLIRELLSAPAGRVPENVRESMAARLARCSAGARQLCEVVALVPGRAELDLVAPLAGGGPAIDEAVARGIIVHADGHLAFRHELARQAVEDLVLPAAARGWHAALLTGLRAANADIARQVHHARCAGDRQAIVDLAPEAARRAAALGAHREAAAHYATALLFAGTMTPVQHREVLEKHGFECYLTSQIAAAIASTETVLGLWRGDGDRAAEGRTLRFLSRLHWYNGDRRQAERHAAEALDSLLPLPPGPDLAAAYSNLSQLAMLKYDVASAVAHGEKALTLARAAGDPAIESHALNNIGTALMAAGDPRGLGELQRSLALALHHGLHEHAARSYVNIVSNASWQEDPALTRRYLQEGVAYCEERDLDAWRIYLRMQQATFDLARGGWDQARAGAAAVLQDHAVTPISRIHVLVVLARVHGRRGTADARAWLEEARKLALATDEAQRIGPVAAARAEAAWLAGDTAGAAAEAAWGLEWVLPGRAPWLAGELIYWASFHRSPDEVPDWVAPPWRHALAGDWRAAADGFETHELPYERALLLARGSPQAGREARDRLTALGATAVLARL